MARQTRPKARNPQLLAIGTRLRIEREAQGISLNDLCVAIGCAINTVRWHEAGSRMMRADQIVRCATVLRLDAPALMLPVYPDSAPMKETRVALGALMTARRTALNLAQVDVVKNTSVPLHELLAHEEGERCLRVDQLFAVAKALKVEPAALMAVVDG